MLRLPVRRSWGILERFLWRLGLPILPSDDFGQYTVQRVERGALVPLQGFHVAFEHPLPFVQIQQCRIWLLPAEQPVSKSHFTLVCRFDTLPLAAIVAQVRATIKFTSRRSAEGSFIWEGP